MDKKNVFCGIKSWLVRHKPSKRRLIQIYAALLYNANIKGFANGKIYTGDTKNVCVPGLNCYSCPGAVGACPLGSLQNALASGKTSSLAYVFGIFVLLGLLLGRTICGFLCPFGLIQELLNKIPSPKLKKNKVTKVLSYFKYVILVGLVVMVPLVFSDSLPVPGFCKYICPDGTLLGAISLLIHPDNTEMFGLLGPLFTWKFSLLVVFLVASIFIYRFFCRFFCPLGAIYGFFCKVALLGVKLDEEKCVSCGKCVEQCQMDIRHVGDHECIHCGKCIPVCPTKAIRWSGSKFFVADPTSGLKKDMTAEQQAQVEVHNAKLAKRRKICKITAVVLALTVLCGALWYYNIYDVDTSISYPFGYGPNVGDLCPDFTLPIINSGSASASNIVPTTSASVPGSNSTFTLSENRGKITVINFWATWCTPCVQELPHFEELSKQYSDDLTVVAIAADSPDQAFLDSKGWQYCTFLWDVSDACYGYSTLDAIATSNALPITVIVDQQGKITFRKIGSMKYEDLLEQILPLLPTE